MKQMKHDIERVLEDAVSKGETSCVAVLLWHNDEEAMFTTHGYADIAAQKPVTRDSLYRLYSLSKPMTAVAAMTLIERGKLDIIAPVSDFLEGFQNQRVALSDTETEPVKRPVQVRDLFTMTSGLPYPGETEPAERAMAAMYEQLRQEMIDQKPLSTIDAANRIGRCPLAHQPGEAFKYGTSADVLGAIIEVVSGKPLNQYMTEVLFGPLQMADSDFYVPNEKRDRLVTVYERTDAGLTTHPHFDDLHGVFSLPSVLEGGAGVFSTIDDVTLFGRMLLSGGKLKKERILSKNAVAWLSENHLTPKQQGFYTWDSVLGYGYGGLMRVMLSPGQSFSLGVKGEYGWDGWTGTYMSVSPETNTVLTVMQQIAGAGTNAVIRKLRNVVYANI
ncbi:MAG TPA: serine hydrolase domain-containing protein [Candidatus Limiplasma sp.]|nr:serine hydrolase domain-containing protein [Candidatus Limiplasma sp.]HRX09014.1 serine hydrolase domain-containing protein [Candidatus Limiplasma sp.]